ncbi:hypothetical protein [Mucilaginibacter sp.]|jgi:hypothetical protein
MKTLLKNPVHIAMILLGATVLIAIVMAVINIATGHYSHHAAF